MEEDFIRMKSSSHSKKKRVGISQKDKNINGGHPATSTSNSKQESSEIDSLIKQFGEMKILLAEAVTKVDRLEQSKNSCKNCRSSAHTTPNCNQPCKVCQRPLGVHVFWKCPNYNISSNRSNPSISAINTNPADGIEHVLLEDDDDFDPFSNTLEDFLAHEETQPRKRVRVEDIEDEADRVKFVSITSSASNPTNPTADSNLMATKKPARPRKSRSIKDSQDPSPANKAAVQLMGEAKLSLTLQ